MPSTPLMQNIGIAECDVSDVVSYCYVMLLRGTQVAFQPKMLSCYHRTKTVSSNVASS